ncbi:hypothetical protein NL676_024088 [Syzygium grande]|nr:hypothetical protein NL676_024088 [Syzygium grande]
MPAKRHEKTQSASARSNQSSRPPRAPISGESTRSKPPALGSLRTPIPGFEVSVPFAHCSFAAIEVSSAIDAA